jgi:hypothetical protein
MNDSPNRMAVQLACAERQRPKVAHGRQHAGSRLPRFHSKRKRAEHEEHQNLSLGFPHSFKRHEAELAQCSRPASAFPCGRGPSNNPAVALSHETYKNRRQHLRVVAVPPDLEHHAAKPVRCSSASQKPDRRCDAIATAMRVDGSRRSSAAVARRKPARYTTRRSQSMWR